jgi:hypothetical protein
MKTCYPLAQIQALAEAGQVLFANQRAERNVLELAWTNAMLAAFVCGLRTSHHRGMRPGLSVFDGRGVIDADKYRARFNEATLKVTVDSRCCEYFVELAVKSLPSGTTVLIVSFHLDGQP